MSWYPVRLERDSDGHVLVDFPDFPEAHTYGDDEDEALVRARDALATIIDAYIQDRRPIPFPSHLPGTEPRVRLAALTAAKVQLYNAMREKKVTKTELARRLHWHLPQVDRLFDVYHGSRLDQLEAAASVLGKELSFYMTDHETVRAIQSPGYRAGRSTTPGRSGAATGMGSRKATGARKRYPLAGKHPPKSKARRSSRKRA